MTNIYSLKTSEYISTLKKNYLTIYAQEGAMIPLAIYQMNNNM